MNIGRFNELLPTGMALGTDGGSASHLVWSDVAGTTATLPIPSAPPADDLPPAIFVPLLGEGVLVLVLLSEGEVVSVELHGALVGRRTLAHASIQPGTAGEIARITMGASAGLVVPVSVGHVDAQVRGNLVLKIFSDRTELWTEPAPGDVTVVELGLDLVLRWRHDVRSDLIDDYLARLPFVVEAAVTDWLPAGGAADTGDIRRLSERLLRASFDLGEPCCVFVLRHGTSLLEWGQLAGLASRRAALHRSKLPELEGPWFADLGVHATGCELLGDVTVGWHLDGFTVEGLSLDLSIGATVVHLRGGSLRLDRALRVSTTTAELSLSFVLDDSVDVSPGGLFTLVLHRRTAYRLSFDEGGMALECVPNGASAAASIYMPAIGTKAIAEVRERWDYDGPEDVHARFVLDVGGPASSSGLLRLAPSGTVLVAKARARRITIDPLRDLEVTDGTIEARGGRWWAEVHASARLPWLTDATGTVGLSAGSGVPGGLAFDASFRVAVGTSWHDPTGTLAVHDPVVWVRIAWKDSKWSVSGALGGSLELCRVPIFAGDAEWLTSLFDGLRIEFDGLAVGDMDQIDDGHDGHHPIRLSLQRGFSCTLWSIFTFRLTGLRLGKGGLTVEGDLRLGLGPMELEGHLPGLAIDLDGSTPRVIGDGAAFSIGASLRLPGGIAARMRLARIERDGVWMLEGEGNLTTPSLPDADVLVALGRFPDGGHKKPTIAIFGEVAANQQLYPGVVLRRAGIGLGIHRTLRGVGHVSSGSGEDALRVLSSPGAAPDPAKGEHWELATSVAVSLVCHGIIASTTSTDDEIDYYVADLLVSVDSQLRLTSFLHAWLLTSVDDARKNEKFRTRPYAKGIAEIDPRTPSMVAAYRTRRDSESTLADRLGPAGEIFTRLASGAETRMTFEARPHLLALEVGPTRYAARLGPFADVVAESRFGIRIDRNVAVAAADLRWHSRLGGEARGRLGPLEFGVAVDAGFDASVAMLGGIVKGPGNALVLHGWASATAFVEVRVWATLRLEIRIRFGFFKVRVSISTIHASLSFGVHVQVSMEIGLGPRGLGASATMSLGFNICGVGVSAPVTIDFEKDRLTDSRSLANAVLKA